MSKLKGVAHCEECDTYYPQGGLCSCDREAQLAQFQMDFLKLLKNESPWKVGWTEERGEWELVIETEVGSFIIALEKLDD